MAACKMVPSGFDPDPSFGAYAPMVGVLALRAKPFLWRMNMKTGEGREEQLDDRLSEFPVVNCDLTGRQTQYAYHVVMDDNVLQRFSGLLKYDLTTGQSQSHTFPEGVFGSEPVFAPSTEDKLEDDGYVITFVTDRATMTSEAHIIHAQDFTSTPIARVKLPLRIPLGFHGTWAQGV